MFNPLFLIDGYKLSHREQYPKGTSLVYSNLTARGSRMEGVKKTVFFGLQYFILRVLGELWGQLFFNRPLEDVLAEYRKVIAHYLNTSPENVPVDHIVELHNLGYLPIRIKALKEGTLVPLRVPYLTICNTLPQFFWLTNYLETVLSNCTWKPITSATIAYEFRKLLDRYADETGDPSSVQWQGHDFSSRGMSGFEDAALSGMGHLLSFTGSDTVNAIDLMSRYYGVDLDTATGPIFGSIPASEHSCMMMAGSENEFETFKRFVTEIYPNGFVSIVSDTWNLWTVLDDFLPRLKDEIMTRDGRLIIRPDSGDPVDIICGLNTNNRWAKIVEEDGMVQLVSQDVSEKTVSSTEYKGVIESLWDTFGGTINEQGYKVLDPHIGAIYGDGITLHRAEEICRRLKEKGFASTNIVLGIGLN